LEIYSESSNYKKHTASKGIRRKLINNFNRNFLSYINIIYDACINNVLDIGCGEGFMLKLIHERYESLELTGCDVRESALNHAKIIVPSAYFFQNDEYQIKLDDKSFDLVICTEVLEHLKEPDKMIQEIQRVCRKFVILTVPHEPFFRLGNLVSGKYLNTFGNHHEHIQHFNIKSFKKKCNNYFDEIKCSGIFPWVIYMGGLRSYPK